MKNGFSLVLFGALAITTVANAFASGQERHGIYIGAGGAWNSLDEDFHSTLTTSNARSATDHYNASLNRLAPMLQLGYSMPFCRDQWLWGAMAQWKYVGYRTPNEGSSQGQHIPNATFSSINFFGADVHRDFNSESRIDNEFMMLLFLGAQLPNGFVYFGAGPVLFTASNSIYNSSVHEPNGVGDNLVTKSVSNSTTLWGGAAQAGYNYYLDSSWFLSVNYTYARSGTNHFDNSVNAAQYNGSSAPGPVTLNLQRSINVTAQEVMFSINKVF